MHFIWNRVIQQPPLSWGICMRHNSKVPSTKMVTAGLLVPADSYGRGLRPEQNQAVCDLSMTLITVLLSFFLHILSFVFLPAWRRLGECPPLLFSVECFPCTLHWVVSLVSTCLALAPALGKSLAPCMLLRKKPRRLSKGVLEGCDL